MKLTRRVILERRGYMEKWDVLDGFGNRTARTVTSGGELSDGEYHLVVHAWIINSINGK